MNLTVEHLGAVQFEVRTRGLSVISDQPAENGGFDEGMTPPEFLLAALGSCAGYYAVEYLKAQKLRPEGTKVHVSAEKVKNPPRMDNFQLQIEVPMKLTVEQQEAVRCAVNKCLVHNTLTHPPQITTEVLWKESVS